MKNLAAVILAAGEGKRMKSRVSKVLHEVCARPMIDWVIEAAQGAGAQECIVVVGHNAEQVIEHLGSRCQTALQAERLGTAHAVQMAAPLLKDFDGDVMVLGGDMPMVTADTLAKAYDEHCARGAAATVLTAEVDDPTGYGRVLCSETGELEGIVEQKDADEEQQKVRLINAGMYFFDAKLLFSSITEIKNDNAQSEYYLPDVLGILKSKGHCVSIYQTEDAAEILGVNDRVQLAQMNKLMNERILDRVMRDGVTIVDPASTFIAPGVRIGMDTVIHPGSIVSGNTVIGENCVIGPMTRLEDMRVADGVKIVNSVCMQSEIGEDTTVGPFAYIRPNCKIGSRVKLGDFVEIKNSSIDTGTKVSHLTYVGDSEVGSGVNFGCGTVTVNYDGTYKYKTVIGDNAFIGCNTNLVAPVEVAADSFIAAGSTITDFVPSNSLAVARARQTNIEDWVTRRKSKEK